LQSVRDAFPETSWPELGAAVERGGEALSVLMTDEVLSAQPPPRLYALATELLAAERMSDADRVLDRALALDPGSFRLHFLSAAIGFQSLRIGSGDRHTWLAKTLHHLEVAVALRPRSGFVRAMLATALAINERYEDSVTCMDAATALEPDNPLVWLLKARFYSYAPDPQPGIEACRRALELDPELDDARALMAELEARVKKQ
jgi:predicted Zn-dependent protease